MSKYNAGRTQRLEASRAMDTNGVRDAISEEVTLLGSDPESIFGGQDKVYTNESLPTAPVGVNDGVQTMLPLNSPDQVVELEAQQRAMAASASIQQLADTEVLSNWGPSNIAGIVGEANKPRFVQAIMNLKKTDSVKIPLDDKRSTVAAQMLNYVPPNVKLAEDPDIPKVPMVDANRTRKLTPANLFSHLKMIRRTAEDDVRMFEIEPDAQILGLVVMEDAHMRNLQDKAIIPQEMIDNFTEDEISEMTGMSGTDLDSGITLGKLGRDYHKQLMMMQQVAAEGKDIIPDAHLDPKNQLTKEAYEQLGMWLKQSYNLANPENTKLMDVGTKGYAKYDYILTNTGVLALENARQGAIEPDVRVRTQVIDKPKSDPYGQESKGNTGRHYIDPADKKRKLQPEIEAMSNVSAVKHMVAPNRMKPSLIIFIKAIANASAVKVEGGHMEPRQNIDGSVEEVHIKGRLVVQGVEGNSMGIGQKMTDKINNTSDNLMLKAQAITLEMEASGRPDPDKKRLVQVLEDFAKTAVTTQWRQQRFSNEATKALAMVQDVAEVYGQPIGFPTYLQSGSSRISYATQVMNVQNNKFARQLYGSGIKYQIKPGVNSYKEQALLVTWGAHFFAEGNLVPEQLITNMRDRITSKDSKLMAIASVGRKLKGALDGYNLEAPIAAILKMDMKDRQVTGVSDVINSLDVDLNVDPDVKRFMDEVSNHPNEYVNLIEEAIELAAYMDAVENDGTFTSQMRPIEVDGIMNGIASMSAQLGILDVMYRVGVLREEPTRVLAEYEGLEGKLRDLMSDNMKRTVQELSTHPSLRKEFGIDESDVTEIDELLDLAIMNADEFLKPPIMTFAYGQAIASMLGGVLNAISTSESLRLRAENSSFGTLGTAKLLHAILAKGIEDTLSPKILQFAEALKDMTQVGMLSNEPIRFQKATGTWTSINSNTMVPNGTRLTSTIHTEYSDPELAGRQFGDAKKSNPSTLIGEKGKPVSKAISTEIPMTEGALTALGLTAQGGSKTRQGILAQSIISNDGSVVSNMLSGKDYQWLKNESGTQVPYVSVIYDAFVGDLGSFMPLLQLSNRMWVKVNIKYDLIKSLSEGARDAHARGKARLKAAASSSPDSFMKDKEHAQHLVNTAALIAAQPRNPPVPSSVHRMNAVLKDLNIRFENRSQNQSLTSTDMRNLTDRSHMITNSQALELFTLLTPRVMRTLAKMNKIASDAAVDRAELLKVIGPNPVNQFAVDGLKSFNFY